jgi:hypothetical protein
VTTPAVEGLLNAPYISLNEFRAAPTWIDTQDLIPGGATANEDDEMTNVLLRASAWADSYCGLRLGAHQSYEQTRARVDRQGVIKLHPSNVPVRQLTGLAYGSDFQNLTQITDFTQTWIEDARGIIVSSIPWRGSWAGSLEFGSAPPWGGEVYVVYSYVAGFASTTLASPANAAATSLTLADPTGLQPPNTTLIGTFGSSTARIWDPGLEEAVTVAPGYTAGANPVPLVSGLLNSHDTGTGVSEFPAEVHQAVIALAVALLMREDVADDDPWPDAQYGPAARRSGSGGRAGGLVETAWQLLDPYRRVR